MPDTTAPVTQFLLRLFVLRDDGAIHVHGYGKADWVEHLVVSAPTLEVAVSRLPLSAFADSARLVESRVIGAPHANGAHLFGEVVRTHIPKGRDEDDDEG